MPLLVIVVLLELCPLSSRLVKVPTRIEELSPIYQHVKKLPPDATLLELPLARGPSEEQLETEARTMYHSTFHWRRIANGYSGFAPRANIELKRVIAISEPETVMSAFKTFGIQYVLTREEELNENEKQKLQALEAKGLTPLAHDGEHRLYRISLDSTEAEKPLPDLTSLTFYESRTSTQEVTLCLYYQVDENTVVLTTPWKHQVKCDVAWYEEAATSADRNDNLPASRLQTGNISQFAYGEPVLISTGIHRNSKLITNTSNAIEINLSAPPPGKYRVVVQQRSETTTLTKNGICHIHENGLVTFELIS